MIYRALKLNTSPSVFYPINEVFPVQMTENFKMFMLYKEHKFSFIISFLSFWNTYFI